MPDSESNTINTPAHDTIVLPVSPARSLRCSWWIWPSHVGPLRVPRISPVYSLTNTIVPPTFTDHARCGDTLSPYVATGLPGNAAAARDPRSARERGAPCGET